MQEGDECMLSLQGWSLYPWAQIQMLTPHPLSQSTCQSGLHCCPLVTGGGGCINMYTGQGSTLHNISYIEEIAEKVLQEELCFSRSSSIACFCCLRVISLLSCHSSSLFTLTHDSSCLYCVVNARGLSHTRRLDGATDKETDVGLDTLACFRQLLF